MLLQLYLGQHEAGDNGLLLAARTMRGSSISVEQESEISTMGPVAGVALYPVLLECLLQYL